MDVVGLKLGGMMQEVLMGLQRTSTASLLFTGFALLVGGLLVYLYKPYWELRKIPGPPVSFLVGHLPLMMKHGPQVFHVLAEQYGPIYRFHMGRQPLVIIADAELCKEVGIKKFKSMANRSAPAAVAGTILLRKGLFSSKEPRWSAMRNAIVPLYQPSHLASLIPTMQSYIESAATHLSKARKEEEVMLSDLTFKMATDVLGKTAFGVKFGLLDEGKVRHSTNSNMEDEVSAFVKLHMYASSSLKMDLSGSFSFILGALVPILQEPVRQVLKRIPWTADRNIDQTNLKLAEKVDEIVAKKAKSSTERTAKDLVSTLLKARESDAAGRNLFGLDNIRSLVYEHLLAGSPSTSFALSCLVYLVSKHPEVEKKLLKEIDEFGPHDLIPNIDDLQHKFPYLDQVVKETLRFFTASPVVARETSKAVEVGGYILPKGTWVWPAVGVLAKDPKNFPEPDVFRPERFDPACDEERTRHPYAHIPFGIGPRKCPGEKFALQEIKLAVVHLYRNYTFKHSPNMEYPLEFEYSLSLGFRHGVKVYVVPRSKN